jgi:beta-phosphoglucomutase-like phosphatase (HAD superfamily)
VIEAFLAGLEAARAAGRDLSGIAAVASLQPQASPRCASWPSARDLVKN